MRLWSSGLALSWGPQKPKGAHAVCGHCEDQIQKSSNWRNHTELTSPRPTSSIDSLTFLLAINANITDMSATEKFDEGSCVHDNTGVLYLRL